MIDRALLSQAKQLRRASLFALVITAGLVGCGDSEEPGFQADSGPVLIPDGGGVGPIVDSGFGNPGQDSGAPGQTVDAGSNVGAVDTPWCKAKQVFDKHCVACHDGKGTAGTPMGLTSLADFTAQSSKYPGSTIAQRVKVRMHDTQSPMPPRNPPSAAELALVDSWVEGGAQPGSDPTCASAGGSDAGAGPGTEVPWPEHCDATYKLLSHAPGSTAKYTVKAGTLAGDGKTVVPFQEHPQVELDAPWGDEEVQAIAFRPITDNAKVLHHWILYELKNGQQGAFLNGWAPGSDGGPLPSDVGVVMPKGKRSMKLDVHYYNTTTKAEPDASGVEICVLKKANFRKNSASVFSGFSNLLTLSVNRGEMRKDIVGNCKINARQPITLLTSSPHMHVLGVHAKLEVRRANGKVETLHNKPFNFEEQDSYPLNPPVVINTGDTVITTCTYSFPQDDTFHVDPRTGQKTNNVRFGQDTEDEMCFNFTMYYPKDAFDCALF